MMVDRKVRDDGGGNQFSERRWRCGVESDRSELGGESELRVFSI